MHTLTRTHPLTLTEMRSRNLYAYPYTAATPGPNLLRPVPLLHARCVVLNAVAGLFYAMILIGLDPNMPDPTLK